MLALFTYELLFAWDGGIRRFCPLLFKFLPFDPPPLAPPPPPVVFELLLYTGERRRGWFVELVDAVGRDVVLPPVIVADEPLFSDRCNKQCDARENN